MKQSSVGISREGFPFLIIIGFCTLIFVLAGWKCITIIGLILFLFTMNFFRDPERVTPHYKGLAVAPADGKIIKIDNLKDPMTGETRQTICIFMNVFNVHVNRMPVCGKIEDIAYHPGKFINASFDKASTDNERNSILLRDANDNTWTVVQIAGLIARRIVCWGEVGDEFTRGKRFGLIRFGSRVDVYLPINYSATVSVGDKVIAGQTVIAKIPPNGTGA